MRSLISKLRFDRLRKALFADSSNQQISLGKTEVVENQEAIAVVESMICDAIAIHSGDDVAQSLEQVPNNGGPTGLNAFGTQVVDVQANSVSGALAAGEGVGLTGLRSSVFLSGDRLTEGFGHLQSLANRHVPLVIHPVFRERSGIGSSHASYHGASDLGLFQILPHTIQQAIDFTVLAHWLAERSLIPGVVGLDRHVVESAVLPSSELLRSFLGYADEEIGPVTPAQLLLFGGKRPPVPSWYNLDRPVSFSSLQGSNDGASATIGRNVFFWKHLPELAKEGMSKLGALTGRPLSPVTEYLVRDAELVIAAQGLAYQTACCAAEYLRREKKLKVGVLGVTWLRPFPSSEVRDLLSKKKVLVLEATNAPLSEGSPLQRELRAVLNGTEKTWTSALYGMHGQPLNVGEVIELALRSQRKSNSQEQVWLGINSAQLAKSEFPKREGMVKAVGGDYPSLKEHTVGVTDPVSLNSQDAKTVLWVGSEASAISDVMGELGKTCAEVTGAEVHGFGWSPEPGVFSVRVSGGDENGAVAEAGSTVDVLLLGRHGLDLIYNPLSDLGKGKAIVIESARTDQEVWNLMPDFWRSEIQRRQLKLFKIDDGFPGLVSAAKAILSDSLEVPPALNWLELEDPTVDPGEVPQLIRRVKEASSEYDNLPRFWGEVMQPKRGGISDNFPDPLSTIDSVPPYTAALARPRGTALPNIPELDPEKCTACGRCWTVCPDSAIGVAALGIQEALDAASALTGCEGKVANAVKRSHKPLAAKLASLLAADSAGLTEKLVSEAYAGIVEKLKVSSDDRSEHDRVFSATVDALFNLPPAVTERLYSKIEQEKKGDGQLLFLAINPDACQGCQLCISICPESALQAQPRGSDTSARNRSGWKLWEQLPDTQGRIVEKALKSMDWGEISAALLSRHCSQVQAVGSFGEPGSGERLAARLVSASVEAVIQKRMMEHASKAQELAEALTNDVHSHLAEGLVDADPASVEAALASLPRRRASLSELTDRLGELGKAVSVDPSKTLQLAQTAHQLESEKENLEQGVHGLGRSRFGAVILSRRIARWAGRFPNHPYHAPLIVEPTPDGAQLVLGLAQALALQHVQRIRLLRKAELLKASPPDMPGRLIELSEIRWADLSEEEKGSCPPLLVLTDEVSMVRQGLSEISSLLLSGLPVKIVLLDGKSAKEQGVEPALLAIAHGSAYVSCSSLGHLQHLGSSVAAAVKFYGPALIHIHVPIPQEHGFTPSKTIERARDAVEARVHPLLTYNPSIEGVFGIRVSLQQNPSLESDWGEVSYFQWARGEDRYRGDFFPIGDDIETTPAEEFVDLSPEERGSSVPAVKDDSAETLLQVSNRLTETAVKRLRIWRVLKEVAGQESPFADRIRASMEEELEEQSRQSFDAMKQDYETKLAEMQRDVDGRMASQLRERLLKLAGFGASLPQSGNQPDE